MITTSEGQFVTARTYPKLVLIKPGVVDGRLILSAADARTIEVDINELQKQPTTITSVWKQDVETTDAGDEVAEWLSQIILGQENGLRLVFYPGSLPSRDARSLNVGYKYLKNDDAVRI